MPLGELREELKRLVERNEKWNRGVCGLQVTDTKESTIEVREGLIEFLRANYPESLPRVRTATIALDETATTPARGATLEGKEHERGPSSPGLAPEKSDGTAG